MKFLTWNIKSGGFDGYSKQIKKPKRLDNIIEIVKKSNADFVSLIDTFMWDTHFTTEQISTLFGYKYVYCINLEDERLKKLGHNNGITVLTNLDNPHFETIRISTRNIIKTHFDNNISLDIFSIYLDDVSEDTRLNQISTLNKHILLPQRTIITGDLNTISKNDVQNTKILVNNFYKTYPILEKKFSKYITDMMRCDAIEMIENFGLHNASSKFAPTMPTPLLVEKQPAFLRLDYVFLGSDLVIASFQVLKNIPTDFASDHYPIQFNIRL